VFWHATECNTNKSNIINVSVFRTLGGGLGLWFPFYHPKSTTVRRAPALTLYQRVFLSLSPHTCTLCPMLSLNPCVVGLVPPCTCWRKDTITQLRASHTCVTWSAKSLSLYIKFCELGLEVTLNHRSTVDPLLCPSLHSRIHKWITVPPMDLFTKVQFDIQCVSLPRKSCGCLQTTLMVVY